MHLGGRLDVCDSLVQSAVNYFEDQKINLINAWQVKGHKSENILKRHGFVNSRKELGIYFNPIAIGDDLITLETAKPSELHFQYGDTDWI